MITAQQVEKAIAAHGQWKKRLQTAIATGASEFKQSQVRLDNACDFGKWLHGLDQAEQQKPIWKEVQANHAKFHLEAARILEMALQGKKSEALSAIETHSEYGRLTGNLILLLKQWEQQAG